MKTKIIVVAGGVISGVGKGVITASLGKIIKEHGFSTTLIKIDPYINYDAGTLRPTEHGEVWVTEDGGEIDQDLGTYERFLDQDIPKRNNITTGQIYKEVIDRERRGEYLGQTVQFIPHIIDEIKRRILIAAQGYEFVIIEIGGTAGDYENVPFLHAVKSIEREWGADRVAYVLVSYFPIPDHVAEMKTKPTQQAIRQLGQEGILPDFIICRAKHALDEVRKKKLEVFANVCAANIISAPDIDTIYQMPLLLEQERLGQKVLAHFGQISRKEPDWSQWNSIVQAIKFPDHRVSVAIVGKYLETGDYNLVDSYVSIYQALIHAAAEQKCAVDITWINAKNYEDNPQELESLSKFDGILVPGGFGSAGVEGKISVINYARLQEVPYLGLCYGMQLAVVEYARSVARLSSAHTTEVDPTTAYPVIDVIPLQKKYLAQANYGGTMRLGGYVSILKKESIVSRLYGQNGQSELLVSERHRHRYEVNPTFVSFLEQHGLVFSGYHKREDETVLMEYLELPNHPFFVATQAHPEFKSRLGNANPIFKGFVQACLVQHLFKQEHIPAIKTAASVHQKVL